MDIIKAFVQDLINKEYWAEFKSRDHLGNTYQEYEDAYAEVYRMYHLTLPFINGRVREDDVASDDEKHRWSASASFVKPRTLFKIMQFRSSSYDELYVTYTSSMNSNGNGYFNALFIAPINGEYKIISKYSQAYDDWATKGLLWEYRSGERMPKSKTGKIITLERFIPPVPVNDGLGYPELEDWHKSVEDYAKTGWNQFFE